jgi:hypothetical protein
MELIHYISSDVCPRPPPKALTLQNNSKICRYTLLKNLKVENGDICEIVASMLSPAK